MKTSPMNPMKHNLIKELNAYFNKLPFSLKGKKLCVCLSGGADSVSLLRGLLAIKNEYEFTVFACHFNHLIRDNEADRDEEFCKQLCNNLGIELFCGADDVPARAKFAGLSIEDAARKCRYEFFERVMEYHNIDYCVTAHTINDDAETLLLNLIRGSGVNGASSIASYNNSYLRPMLKIHRYDVEDFLEQINQDFVTDSTNFSDEYRRNYIRHNIIPQLEKLNPSVLSSISRFIDSSREDRAFFEKLVSENMETDLRTLDIAIRKRIIIKIIRDYTDAIPNHQMISEINKAILSDKRAIIPLFNEFEAVVNSGKLYIGNVHSDCIPELDAQLIEQGENIIFGNRVTVSIAYNKEQLSINKIFTTDILSFDNIRGKLMARNRRVGDKITINGINRSLKKLFIEKKVPKEYRDLIPIIFDELGIIYVPFVGIADRVKPNNGSNHRHISVVLNTIDKERWSNVYEK